jgi:hypothetical protein
VKKLKKLAIRKITLQDLDEPLLYGVAGGATLTCVTNCVTCRGSDCSVCATVCVCNTDNDCKPK